MTEPTKAILMLGGFTLLVFLIFWFIPNKTTVENAERNVKNTAEQVKLYVDKKARDAVESTKITTKSLEERVASLEKNDLTKEVLELQEQVSNLVTENGQLKIYIANLEDKANTSSQVDKALLAGAEAHYKEFNEYKLTMNAIFQTLGEALGSISAELVTLDTRLDKVESQEKSVLTKQTIIKTYFCRPRRCCR
jgi:chromosome segregation ATPase